MKVSIEEAEALSIVLRQERNQMKARIAAIMEELSMLPRKEKQKSHLLKIERQQIESALRSNKIQLLKAEELFIRKSHNDIWAKAIVNLYGDDVLEKVRDQMRYLKTIESKGLK
jgi:hypothetical protein